MALVFDIVPSTLSVIHNGMKDLLMFTGNVLGFSVFLENCVGDLVRSFENSFTTQFNW